MIAGSKIQAVSKNLKMLVLSICLLVLSGVTASALTQEQISNFQPQIKSAKAPERPLNGRYELKKYTTAIGVAAFLSQIPSFQNKGKLIASWNPRNNPEGKITFVVLHGGFGIVPADIARSLWLQKTFDANILILDSFWSRGRNENWKTATQFGANMRMLDVIATGRWLVATKKVDPRKLFLIGGSQGGWTVLRSFTNDPWIVQNVRPLYAGGISLWPNCKADGSPNRPPLGPYFKNIIVFTGGKDKATPISECDLSVLKNAGTWTHYDEATHGWDHANPLRGSKNGECNLANNPYRPYPVCRNDISTLDTYKKIEEYVRKTIR
jgi:dienelactone hydrolase